MMISRKIEQGVVSMADKKHRSSFGERLSTLRKEKGYTQEAFSQLIGISRRALAYYEVESDRPPTGDTLLKMAAELDITVDQLLGVKSLDKKGSRKEARLLNKLKQVGTLSKQDQRAVLRFIDALVKTSQTQTAEKELKQKV